MDDSKNKNERDIITIEEESKILFPNFEFCVDELLL